VKDLRWRGQFVESFWRCVSGFGFGFWTYICVNKSARAQYEDHESQGRKHCRRTKSSSREKNTTLNTLFLVAGSTGAAILPWVVVVFRSLFPWCCKIKPLVNKSFQSVLILSRSRLESNRLESSSPSLVRSYISRDRTDSTSGQRGQSIAPPMDGGWWHPVLHLSSARNASVAKITTLPIAAYNASRRHILSGLGYARLGIEARKLYFNAISFAGIAR
jgi:hypothetical protein